MAADPVNVALVGYGTAGAVFHAPLIAATDGLRLAAVVTRDAERADAVRRAHPGARVHPSADGVFVDAGAYDLVVIATPHSTHVPLARAAVRAGLAVVIDKPLAASLREAEAFAAELTDLGATGSVSVFHNRRWDGDFLTVRGLLDSGRLGAVHRLESRIERWRPTPRPGSWRELAPAGDDGGVLLDLGPHLVDQALQLLGPAESVYAEVFSRRPGVSAGDDTFIAVRHAGGATSHLSVTATAAQLAPRFRVLGSEGSFTKSGLDVQEAQLRAGRDPRSEAWGIDAGAAWGALSDGTSSTRVPTVRGDWPSYYRQIHDVVTASAPPPVGVDDALDVLRVLEAARRSAGRGETVRVGDHAESTGGADHG